MAFTINLYQTNDDPRQVTKNLTPIATDIQIIPTSSLDVLNPTIIVSYNESYLQANYCYCTLLNRYYYLRPATLDIGKRIIFYGTIDVLMTYDAQIRNCTACVVRNEGIGKPTYVLDNQLPIISGKYQILSQIYPNSPVGNERDFVITTLGG